MATPRLITDLDIVGYATVLKDTMVPSIVPPVFRLKADPSCILPALHLCHRVRVECH
jgi:hypothetical protein